MKPPKMPKMPKMPFGGDFQKMINKAAGGEGVDDRKNPNITGAGTIDGGVFKSLTITGSGTVEGNVEAKEVEVSGAGQIEGDLKAGRVEAAGSLTVEGSMEADAFVNAGSSTIEGSLKADKIDQQGALEVGRDVEAKTFRSSGAFGIEGSLEADEIEIEINGDSHVHAILGKSIQVEAGTSKVAKGQVIVMQRGGHGTTVVTGGTISGNASGYAEGGRVGSVSASSSASVSGGNSTFKLEAKTIEGDEVELEHTVADLVKGKKVKIGKGCKIGAVEYTESIAVDDKASVKKQTKK